MARKAWTKYSYTPNVDFIRHVVYLEAGAKFGTIGEAATELDRAGAISRRAFYRWMRGESNAQSADVGRVLMHLGLGIRTQGGLTHWEIPASSPPPLTDIQPSV